MSLTLMSNFRLSNILKYIFCTISVDMGNNCRTLKEEVEDQITKKILFFNQIDPINA